MRKSKISIILNSLGIIALVISTICLFSGKSDYYLRSRVVKLSSEKGSCSGEQIRSPSGVDYILTAAHCAGLSTDGNSIKATTEDGKELMRRIIAEDDKSDLLLLEGLPNLEGLRIADSSYPREHVRTFTHGHGMPTYKTEGVLIGEQPILVPLKVIVSSDDELACSKPKNKIIDMFGVMKLCMLDVSEMATTALIVPGSSGGLVVDDSGDLAGVVSAGGGGFGFLVPLRHVKDFLKSY